MKIDVKFSESNQSFQTNMNESEQSLAVDFGNVQTINIGKNGLSAYEIALNHGFVGSEKEWLESLNGSDGKDGLDGQPGRDGIDGKDGYTPVKGKDYFDGEPGKDGVDGKDGKDGYTPVKGVDYFDGKNGSDGKDGVDGYTPVKGTDYFTEADRAEMVKAVRAQLITEQWTLTLMDDTVVTKDVVME